MHGIGIHDPPHHLSIRVDIRRWNVAMRPNDNRNLSRIAASETFQFTGIHLLRIANNAAFRSTERYTHNCTFPGHPHGKCFDFVESNIRTVTNATFGWATVDVMLNAITCKSSDPTVIESNRKIDNQFTFGLSQNLSHIF